MHNPHPVKTEITIATATWQVDSDIPGTDYGEEIPVKIISHNPNGDPRAVTVRIGKKHFPVSQIEFILESVKKHNAAVKAWNGSKI